MAKEIVRFVAVKTVKKPVTVKFKTKSGETVSFKALKTVKPGTATFLNGWENLAFVLKTGKASAGGVAVLQSLGN